MKIIKGDFLKLIKEGKDINEIINSDLTLISGGESSDSEEVTNNATTDSVVDASRQQVGKNRFFGTFMEDVNLDEANSELQGKTYTVPNEVLTLLKPKLSGTEGVERIQSLMASRSLSYEQIKRFKHDIENVYVGDWANILSWINQVLANDRDSISRTKQTTMDTGMENRYISTHDKSNIKPTPLTESTNFNDYKTVALRELLKKKREELVKLRSEIKEIDQILKTKKSNLEEKQKNK